MVWATGNGDPANQVRGSTVLSLSLSGASKKPYGLSSRFERQESNAAPSRLAYHGLVRGIIRVSVATGATDEQSVLLAQLNPEAGKGPRSARVLHGQAALAAAVPIVVQATSPGLPVATLSITTSVDPAASVMAVASASIGVAYVGE